MRLPGRSLRLHLAQSEYIIKRTPRSLHEADSPHYAAGDLIQERGRKRLWIVNLACYSRDAHPSTLDGIATGVFAQSDNSSTADASVPFFLPGAGQSIGSWIDDLFIDLPAHDEAQAAAVSEAVQAGTEVEAPGFASADDVANLRNATTASATNNNVMTTRKRRFPFPQQREHEVHEKREYVNCKVHTSTYTNDTEKATYNITIDMSSRPTGVKLDTSVGDWTLTTGETIQNITLRQIVYDIYQLRHTRKSVNFRYSNHTLFNAQAAIDEMNNVSSDSTLFCPNPLDNHAVALQNHIYRDYTQLRRLLDNTASYWSTAIMVILGSGGLAASISAGIEHHYKGAASAFNVVQATVLTAAGATIGSILYRCQSAGRFDRVENVVNRVNNAGAAGAAAVVPPVVEVIDRIVPGGAEAVVQNVYIAWLRRLVRHIKEARQRALERAEGAMNAATDDNAAAAANQAAGSCVSDSDAVSYVSAVENMSDAELELVPLRQAEQAMQAGGSDGDCKV